MLILLFLNQDFAILSYVSHNMFNPFLMYQIKWQVRIIFFYDFREKGVFPINQKSPKIQNGGRLYGHFFGMYLKNPKREQFNLIKNFLAKNPIQWLFSCF